MKLENMYKPNDNIFKNINNYDEDDFDNDKKYSKEVNVEPINTNNRESKKDLNKEFNKDIDNLDIDILDKNIINDVNIDSEYDNFKESDKVLVHRPHKNFKWGLGEQLQRKRVKFTKGEYPTVDEIVNYLEMNNLKDIVVVPTQELGLVHLKRHSIICSGFTSKHIYKTAVDFTIELKNLKIPNAPVPTISGRKDAEWLIINFGEVAIIFCNEAIREELSLEEIWTRVISEEEIEENEQKTYDRIENKLK